MRGRLMAIIRSIAVGIMTAISVWSCQRIELYELSTEVEFHLDMDLSIKQNINMAIATDVASEFGPKITGTMPQYMEVLFYDPETHDLVSSHILPAEGGNIRIAPGEYNVVAYNFGTESTQVENIGHYEDATAFTSDITKVMEGKFKAKVTNSSADGTKGETKGYEDDPIIYEPDHLYVAKEDRVVIPSFEGRDESIELHTTASTILDVYSLEVIGVKGCENVQKVEAFVTGQIKETYFAQDLRGSDPATMYIDDFRVDKENGRFYTVFGTFGKLAGADNHIYLDITVTNADGGQYRYIYDVTDQFEEDGNSKLVVYDEIDIPAGEVGGGGLAPEVGEWDEETIEVPLM